MTKRERVLRTLEFRDVDRVPIYDIVDSNAMREHFGKTRITEENAWLLEYSAVRSLCDATRMLCVPEFHPHRSVDEDGFVRSHGSDTTWIETRPFTDMEGYRRWATGDIKRAERWKPDASYLAEYRATLRRHQEGLQDDTVIIVESDCGLEEPRDKGGIDVSQLLTLGTPDQVREECRKAIDATGGIGYLMGSTTELLPAVKVENVLAMVETVSTHRPR